MDIVELLLKAGATANDLTKQVSGGGVEEDDKNVRATVELTLLNIIIIPLNYNRLARSVQSSTALMLATKRNNTKVAAVLLAHEAEVFMKDDRGRTVMETAKRKKHTEIVKLLGVKEQVSERNTASDP